MSNWTDGYVADINYTYGYFHELNPNRARLALLLAGMRPPAFEHACELGFGQGLSINIHAAGSGVQWHGTDFLPGQAGFAQEVASASGADVTLSDASFAEFCSRQDLPDFDFIALHGIWSWISEANRSLITDFVRRKLKVGGVVYVSYNTQPGWAAMAPLRDLMHDYAQTMTAPGVGVSSQVEASLAFVDELMATQPGYLRANPMVAGHVKDLKSKSRQYLAHEYFNQNWQPMPFARTAALLAAAKLDFACSANLLTHIDALQLTPAQQALLNKIPAPQLRQTVRDFCVNQQFRKDYWVKGSRPLSPVERMEALGAQQFILVAPRDAAPNTVTTPLGEAKLQASIYDPILDYLADHQLHSLEDLHRNAAQHLTFDQVIQAVTVLAGMGILSPAQRLPEKQGLTQSCARLNDYILSKSRNNDDLNYLASPVTGGGVNLHRFEQLFLLARSQGHQSAQDWAAFAWSALASQGEQIALADKVLTTPEENLSELTRQAAAFEQKYLPVLKALKIA